MNEVKELNNNDLLAEYIIVREHVIHIKLEMFQGHRDKFNSRMLEIEEKNLKQLHDEIIRRMSNGKTS